MSFIEWNESLSVKVHEIDEQHKQLIQLINKLYEAKKEGRDKEILQQILDELINYSFVHFTTEEKNFIRFRYENTVQHQRSHSGFVDKITEFKEAYYDGSATLSDDILEFLRDWLINHIKGEDRKYIDFFQEKGLK